MLAGTDPVPFQSGNFAKAHKRFACLKPRKTPLPQDPSERAMVLVDPLTKAREALREEGGPLRDTSGMTRTSATKRILGEAGFAQDNRETFARRSFLSLSLHG